MADNSGGPAVEYDLLGDPVRPIRDPRGRPSYAKSKENQSLVITLRAAGWSQDDIATYMGCDAKTLRKHFSRELDSARVFLDGMALQVLVKKMLDGHVGAAKEVRDIIGLQPKQSTRVAAAKPELIGKKEKLNREARQPTGDWGDILPGIDRPN